MPAKVSTVTRRFLEVRLAAVPWLRLRRTEEEAGRTKVTVLVLPGSSRKVGTTIWPGMELSLADLMLDSFSRPFLAMGLY